MLTYYSSITPTTILRHTQIQKRTINKAAKILWILLTGLKIHKQSNKRDNEIMNYFKRSSPQHCYKHKKIYLLTDSPSFYLFKTKISLNLIINSLVTHQRTFNFIQVRCKKQKSVMFILKIDFNHFIICWIILIDLINNN